jgi:RNA polymerase sigma-70 factor (ECF subfamily)
LTENPSLLRLYLTHRAALVDYAAPIVGCRARAEDVVQEAYIRFSQAGAGRTRGEAITYPVSYLYRIVRNLAIDLSKRLKAEAPMPEAGAVEWLPADTPSVEQSLLYRDELRILAEALADLPERTRTAFDMHCLQGRTLEAVGAHLGVSVVRVHQLVKDAVLHGARKLDGQED